MTLLKTSHFNPNLDTPLYQQLYHHLQAAILAGELQAGSKLPSSRALATELGISRNTVLNTYDQLKAEGYLESFEAKGTFVTKVLPESLLIPDAVTSAPTAATASSPQFSSRAERLLRPAALNSGLGRGLQTPFSFSTPALEAFPYAIWSRLVAKHARLMSADDLKYQEAAGYRPLREAVAAQITLTRQVHCTAEQVLITAGFQGGFNLSLKLLVNEGAEVWVEDPGYLGARGALVAAGATLIPVPVDREGLVVAAGIARAPQARLAYVTPSHQSPLGVTMSVARRLTLLEWAKRADAYIVEDDYDSEYRYEGRPLAALQTLDAAGRVIYIGTFSKVLFPSLRIGYLILPPPLVQAFITLRTYVDSSPTLLEQRVLAAFIRDGHYERHLRRTRKLYAERRSNLLEALKPLPLEVDSPAAGLHCVAWLPPEIEDSAVVQAAAAQGLELLAVSHYCLEPRERQGLLLGFASAHQEAMQDGVRRLTAALAEI